MKKSDKKIVCCLPESAGDWGGASRVLFSNLRLIDRMQFEPLVLLPSKGPVLPLLDQISVPYVIWGQAHEPEGALRYAKAIIASIWLVHRRGVDLLHINGANYWRRQKFLPPGCCASRSSPITTWSSTSPGRSSNTRT